MGWPDIAESVGWLGRPGGHHKTRGRNRVVFLATGPKIFGQASVRDPGINIALLSAACGHIKMWFLGGGALTAARELLLLVSFF